MTRPLPSPELSVNLLREIADGIERERKQEGGAAMGPVRTNDAEPENIAHQVAPKIAGQAFKNRLAQRRQAPVESDRTTDQEQRPRRPRKGPRSR